MNELKHSFGSLCESVAENWPRLRESAASALTRFRPGETSNLPARAAVDDQTYLPSFG